MADALTVLDELSVQITDLTSNLSNKRLKLASSARTQPTVKPMAVAYFEFVRPELESANCRTGLIAEFDAVIQGLIDLASDSREKTYFFGPLKEIRALVLECTIHLMKARGVPRLLLSQTERGILTTLERMLPNTADSYEQVLRDIAHGARVSWRGTAAELREVLREVMDHLAPDDKVTASQGYQQEAGRFGPTQKQKVRFILKARRTGSVAIDTAESTLQTVDESVAALARTTYTRGAASTHTAPEAGEIRKLKRYVDALLAELLEVA
jgi:hypothetical protein